MNNGKGVTMGSKRRPPSVLQVAFSAAAAVESALGKKMRTTRAEVRMRV
jgi:hypothetical protein